MDDHIQTNELAYLEGEWIWQIEVFEIDPYISDFPLKELFPLLDE